MKTPKEKLIEWLERQVEKEKEKWNSGFTNEYYRWCDLRDKVEEYLNEICYKHF